MIYSAHFITCHDVSLFSRTKSTLVFVKTRQYSLTHWYEHQFIRYHEPYKVWQANRWTIHRQFVDFYSRTNNSCQIAFFNANENLSENIMCPLTSSHVYRSGRGRRTWTLGTRFWRPYIPYYLPYKRLFFLFVGINNGIGVVANTYRTVALPSFFYAIKKNRANNYSTKGAERAKQWNLSHSSTTKAVYQRQHQCLTSHISSVKYTSAKFL